MAKKRQGKGPAAAYDGLRMIWGDDTPFYAPRPGARAAAGAVEPSRPAASVAAAATGQDTEEKRRQLMGVFKQAQKCRACELHRTRKKVVFGSGNVDARVAFVGEAPGRDEDEQGKPFVGRSGELLTKIIEGGMGLKREQVFILNVLRCRPPANREPEPEEVEKCRGFLERTLEIIKPELVMALGLSAARALLKTNSSLGSLRGEVHDYRGIPLVATYHPSALLRYPANKRQAWQDIKLALKLLGLPVPGKGAAE